MMNPTLSDVHKHMRNLYNASADIDDCFLSTMDGQPIVERFGRKTRSRTEPIDAYLRQFEDDCPEVEGCALVAVDGLLMVLTVPRNGEDYFAFIAALIMSQSNQLSEICGKQQTQYAYISCSQGSVLVFPAGEEAVLVLWLRGELDPEIIQAKLQPVIAKLIDLI